MSLTLKLWDSDSCPWYSYCLSAPWHVLSISQVPPPLILSTAASSLHISLLGGKSLRISRLLLSFCFWVEHQAGSLRWILGDVWGLLWSSSLLFLTFLVMPWFSLNLLLSIYVGKTWLNTYLNAGLKKQNDPNYFWISCKGRLSHIGIESRMTSYTFIDSLNLCGIKSKFKLLEL